MKFHVESASAPRKDPKAALVLVLGIALTACNQGEAPVGTPTDETGSQVTREAAAPTRVSDDAPLEKTAAATYLHFGDANACTWNPGICQHSGAWWPGYIQNAGGSNWLYAWQSSGPWTAPVGYQPVSESNRHFHITGLMNSGLEPNPMHTAMRGDWWTWIAVKRGSARVNFDLTQIRILGTENIRLWYKDANGNGWQWSSLPPGRWNLPGATNIQEAHITSASGNRAAIFKIDDILITPR